MIPRAIAHLTPGLVRLELRRGRTLRWAAEAEWREPDDLAETLAHLAGECALPRLFRSLEVRVDPALLQLRRLEGMPPVSGKALRSMVGLAPHRYFRKPATAVVSDARWERGRRAGVAIAVAIPLPLTQAIARGARAAGFMLERITPALDGAAARLQLLPSEERVRRESRALLWTRRFGVAAVATWILFGATLLFTELHDRHRVEARLAELQGPLAALLASEASADSAAAMVAQLDADGRAEGTPVMTLFRIAAAIPDSAFLTQIRIDSAGVGLVAGAARRPATVLASLERDGGLRTPRFTGRTTSDLIGGRPVERFAIGFGGEERHP